MKSTKNRKIRIYPNYVWRKLVCFCNPIRSLVLLNNVACCHTRFCFSNVQSVGHNVCFWKCRTTNDYFRFAFNEIFGCSEPLPTGKLSKKERQEKAKKLLTSVGLQDRMDHLVNGWFFYTVVLLNHCPTPCSLVSFRVVNSNASLLHAHWPTIQKCSCWTNRLAI